MMKTRISLSAQVQLVLLLAILLVSFSRAYAGLHTSKTTMEARRLCSRVSEIKRLPLRRDEVKVEVFKQLDPVYGELRLQGEAVVPCLISEVTNRTEMKDPRQAPNYAPVLVGDVAFWVLLDITGMQLETALPARVRPKFNKEGIYAYFDWVRKPGNREKLQKTLTEWYAGRDQMRR